MDFVLKLRLKHGTECAYIGEGFTIIKNDGGDTILRKEDQGYLLDSDFTSEARLDATLKSVTSLVDLTHDEAAWIDNHPIEDTGVQFSPVNPGEKSEDVPAPKVKFRTLD